MKKYLALLFFILCLGNISKAQWVTIPDANFVAYLQTNFPGCMNGNQMDTTCSAIVSLTVLNISNKSIADLTGIQYFDALQSLNCAGNLLTSLPGMPHNLTSLNCINNQLTGLPALPTSLIALKCNANLITSLPNLPNSLTQLECYNNQLDSLPAMPNALSTLWCNNNQLTSLPALPNSLADLDCGFNELTSLPALPGSLNNLECFYNELTSLPDLPDSLVNLDCTYNQLTSLPGLPGSLLTLWCGENQLTVLPVLPDSLTFLYCNTNQLDSLPDLPNTLDSLHCSFNLFTSLPNLPATLLDLKCYTNQLTVLPDLPNTLHSLWCGSNQLTVLPILPSSLKYLNCSNNQLTVLPVIPNSLLYLSCGANQLTNLPALPPVMYKLDVNNNTGLTCLPSINKITTAYADQFLIIGTGISCLPNVIQHPNLNYFPAIDTMPVCDLSYNPANCDLAYNITGKAEFDADADCSTNDVIALHGIKVKLSDNSNNLLQEVFPDGIGRYSFDTGLDTFITSVDTTVIPFSILCPDSGCYVSDLTSIDSMDMDLNFRLKCKYDLAVNFTANDSGIFRPVRTALVRIGAGDFALQFGASCINGNGGVLSVIYNGEVQFAGVAAGSLSPSVISGDTLTWIITDWSTINANSFHIRFKTDSFAVIGSHVCLTTFLSGTQPESNMSNDTLYQCFTIVTSCDPNVKEVHPNEVEQAGEWLTYTIHFQNTGTAEAEHIQVRDTLDSNLDWSSIIITAASHNNITQVNNTNGEVKFNFPNINLVDSTSDEANSHGWIQYRIKMKDNISPPIIIHNTASIYFDFNTPVLTNDAQTSFYYESVSNLTENNFDFNIFPNPATNQFKIESFDRLRMTTSKVGDIFIYDITGRELMKEKMNSNSTLIDASALSSGIYIVELNGERKKLVIQK